MKQKSPRGAWWWSWIFMMSKEPRFLLIFNKITPPKKYLLLTVRTKKGQFLNIYLGLPSLSFHAGCYFPPWRSKNRKPQRGIYYRYLCFHCSVNNGAGLLLFVWVSQGGREKRRERKITIFVSIRTTRPRCNLSKSASVSSAKWNASS